MDAGGREQGTALVLSLFFTVIALGIVASGSIILTSNQQRTDTTFRVNAQATQFARAGITDALSWFRRQVDQPVRAFDPVLDPNTVPPILDTDDPDVGLFREFRIGGNVWGRYEVWKQWPDDPDPDRLALRQQYETSDVSEPRLSQPGTTWRLRSVGRVYRRYDESVPLDERPNVQLGIRILEAEIKRLRLAPPGAAAISVHDGNRVTINTNGRIRGNDGAGIFFPSGTGTPQTGPSRQQRVLGNPSLSTVPPQDYDDSPEAVFGISLAELRSLADDVISDANAFPSPIPDRSVLVAASNRTFQFDSSRPLRGTGIVYIEGNVVISPGSNSVFNGLLYVDGNLTVRAPSEINGAVVCTGNVTVQGASDFATINYDSGILNQLRLEVGNYRLSGPFRGLFRPDR